jgi:hypothetical protein
MKGSWPRPDQPVPAPSRLRFWKLPCRLEAVRDISREVQARDCWLCTCPGWLRLRAATKIVRVAAQRLMWAGSAVGLTFRESGGNQERVGDTARLERSNP